MKRFLFASLTLVCLSFISSCSKDEEPSPAPFVETPNGISGKIDGNNLEYFNYNYNVPAPGEPLKMELRWYTSEDEMEYISLVVPQSIVPGTYDLTEDQLHQLYYMGSDGRYVSTTGTLQILTHDKTNHVVKGKLEANMIPAVGSPATGTHDITEVDFAINYQP